MTEERKRQPPEESEMLEEQGLEEEQQAIELPAREAFSVVLSSPTFLQADDLADDIAEQVLPDDPATNVPA